MKTCDISNKKFGKLTVLYKEGVDKKGHKSLWKCRCDCGNEKLLKTSELVSGQRVTCGCRKRKLEGYRFGKLQVIKKLESDVVGKGIFWECKCDCGKIVKINGNNLNNKIRSCGCFKEVYGPEHMYWKGYGEISNSFFQRIISHARRRKIEFNLTIQEVWDLFLKQNRKCALSGLNLVFPKSLNRNEIITASLDRIDSKKGYFIENVQWVHKDINFMKQSFSTEYFIQLCNQISLFNKQEE